MHFYMYLILIIFMAFLLELKIVRRFVTMLNFSMLTKGISAITQLERSLRMQHGSKHHVQGDKEKAPLRQVKCAGGSAEWLLPLGCCWIYFIRLSIFCLRHDVHISLKNIWLKCRFSKAIKQLYRKKTHTHTHCTPTQTNTYTFPHTSADRNACKYTQTHAPKGKCR